MEIPIYKRILILSIVLISALFLVNTGIVSAQVSEAERTRLEAELAELEAEIAEQEALLAEQKKNSNSIAGEVSVIEKQIANTRAKINAKSSRISQLTNEIGAKNTRISNLTAKEIRQKDSLAQLLRKKRYLDDYTVLEVMLAKDDLSEFFASSDDFESVNRSLQDSFDAIRTTKKLTEEEKESLLETQKREAIAKAEFEAAKKEEEARRYEKEKLLAASQAQEKSYQQIISEREAEAAEIRSTLFELAGGVREGGIPFGEALAYANKASAQTGVRPAFILGVLKQESNFGANVGLCYLRDTTTGAGVGRNTGRVIQKVMKPSRDVQPFLALSKKLGLDPFNTPVSCPIPNVPGWGSAMGPSQFIPSTWAIFKDEIAKKVGVKTANPWNPEHAIMATAVYMQRLGAAKQTYTAEINSACRYYSGASCDHPTIRNLFYGKAVMSHAAKIQKDIDFLNENPSG